MVVCRRRLLLLVILVLLLGCEQQPVPTVTEQATPEPTPTETSQATEELPSPTATAGELNGQLQPFDANRHSRGYNDLRIIISADRHKADGGDSVRIRFTVVNYGDEIQVLESEEKPILDIWVHYYDGAYEMEEWWSDGREITPEMKRLQLSPGESKTIEMTWIAWDEGYAAGESVHLLGVFNGQYREVRVTTTVCVDAGCADY